MILIHSSGCSRNQPAPIQVDFEITGRREIVLGKNNVFFHGVSLTGTNQDWKPLEIDWTVSSADYERLGKGMSLEEVRGILGLEKLRYRHPGPDPLLELRCIQTGSADELKKFMDSPGLMSKRADEVVKSYHSSQRKKGVICLKFEGAPELRLVSKSRE